MNETYARFPKELKFSLLLKSTPTEKEEERRKENEGKTVVGGKKAAFSNGKVRGANVC